MTSFGIPAESSLISRSSRSSGILKPILIFSSFPSTFIYFYIFDVYLIYLYIYIYIYLYLYINIKCVCVLFWLFLEYWMAHLIGPFSSESAVEMNNINHIGGIGLDLMGWWSGSSELATLQISVWNRTGLTAERI